MTSIILTVIAIALTMLVQDFLDFKKFNDCNKYYMVAFKQDVSTQQELLGPLGPKYKDVEDKKYLHYVPKEVHIRYGLTGAISNICNSLGINMDTSIRKYTMCSTRLTTSYIGQFVIRIDDSSDNANELLMKLELSLRNDNLHIKDDFEIIEISKKEYNKIKKEIEEYAKQHNIPKIN